MDGVKLWIGVLGPLQVVRSDTEVRALPAAERAVLGILALADGSPVGRSSLIDVVWGENQPASASGLVYTYISRLRSLLGGRSGNGREVLPSSAGSAYRLRLTSGQLDLAAFHDAVEEARDALKSDDMARACREFERALGLWRGEPLEDVETLRAIPR